MKMPLYAKGNFWVCRESFGTGRFRPKSIGYAVYRGGITHSERVASIGYAGEEGMQKVIDECNRRASREECAGSKAG